MNKELQDRIGIWRRKNFPNADVQSQFLGVVEEVGELSHAMLKYQQGIRGYDYDKFADEAQDAIADIQIYLANFCDMLGWDMAKITEAVFDGVVSQREWEEKQQTLPGMVAAVDEGTDDGSEAGMIPYTETE